MRRLVLCTAALGLACGACQQPAARLNAPPHGRAERQAPLHAEYAQMVDNALLADMVVTDVHFLPHRPMLNSLGEERIARLALLMHEYGGSVRFSTNETDEELVDQRTEEIMKALQAAGIDPYRDVVRRDLPGGRGLDASQAIVIKARATSFKKKQQGGLGG